MTVLLSFLIGLAMGFWAKDMYVMLSKITSLFRDRLESPPGVVRPTGQAVQRGDSSPTGGVLRPNPNQVALDAMIERDRKIKDMSV